MAAKSSLPWTRGNKWCWRFSWSACHNSFRTVSKIQGL